MLEGEFVLGNPHVEGESLWFVLTRGRLFILGEQKNIEHQSGDMVFGE